MSNLMGLFGNLEHDATTNVYNVVAEQYLKNVDETFAKLHSEELEGKAYKKEEYKRVAFRNQQQANEFSEYMKRYNVSAVASTVSMNGQWVVEIPKSVSTEQIKDTSGNSSDDDGLLRLKKQKEEAGVSYVTANEMISNYRNVTGEENDMEVKSVRNADDIYARDNENDIAQDEVTNFFIRNMEGVGEVHSIASKIRTAYDFVFGGEDKQSDDSLFTSRESTRFMNTGMNRNGEIRNKTYNPRIRKDNKQKAYVLNGTIVVMNGVVVKDKELREEILKRHNERMQKASETAHHVSTLSHNTFSAREKERAENNANIVQEQVYQQEYSVSGRAKKEGMIFRGGVLTQYEESLNMADVVRTIQSDYHFDISHSSTLKRVKKNTKNMTGKYAPTESQLAVLEKISDGIGMEVTLSIAEREDMNRLLSTARSTVFTLRSGTADTVKKLTSSTDLSSALEQLSESSYQQLGKQLGRFARHDTEKLSDTKNALNTAEKSVILKIQTQPPETLSEAEVKSLESALQKVQNEHDESRKFQSEIDSLKDRMKFDESEMLLLHSDDMMESLNKVIDYEKKKNADDKDFEMSISDIDSQMLKNYTPNELKEMGISESEWQQVTGFVENKDKMMQNFSALQALEKDFGIKISADKPLTRERILEVNKAFLKRAESAGYQFVTATGSFDVESLKSLSKEDMATLGISESTRDMLVKVNTNSEWGFVGNLSGSLKENAKRGMEAGANAMSKLMSILGKTSDGDTEMRQMQQDYQLARKTTKYSMESAKAVNRVYRSAKLRLDSYRMEHGMTTSADTVPAPKKEVGKKNANELAAKKRTVNAERNNKYVNSMEKKLKRVKSDENSIVNRIKRGVSDEVSHIRAAANASKERAKQAVVNTLSKTQTGQKVIAATKQVQAIRNAVDSTMTAVKTAAAPYIAIAVIIFLLVCCSSMIFIVAITAISSLTEPDYTDKVAYVLYDMLKDREDDWVKTLKDEEVQFKDKEDKKYGTTYLSYEPYVDGLKFLMLGEGEDADDRKLYLNPFNDTYVNETENQDLLTEVEKYDGTQTVGFGTNVNLYSRRREEENFDSGYTSIENGHTSNIKDILAMTDTLYQFDTGSSSDDELTEIMGVTPATIDWENFSNNTLTFFKWLKANTVGWFTNDDDPLRGMSLVDAESEDGTVSFGAVESYVVSLFESSHQEELYLEPIFLPVTDKESITVKSNGSEKVIGNDITQKEASELGYCIEPVTNDLPILWSDNNPIPYIHANDGTNYPTNLEPEDSGFAVKIDMTNLAEGEEENVCLWAEMSNNEETWQKIEDNSQIGDGKNCWEKNELEVERVTESFDSDWYDTYDGVKADITSQVEPRRNETRPDEYVLDKNVDNEENSYFKKTWYTNPATVYQEEIDYETREVGSGNYIYHYYFSGSWVIGDTTWTGDSDDLYSSNSDNDRRNVKDYTNWDDCHGNLVYWSEEIPKTQYKGHVDVAITDINRAEYTRHCKKHSFEYCGGHVRLHTQGVTFSATNEQMAMAGIADPAPVATKMKERDESGNTTDTLIPFDLEKMGYDGLRGKYIDADYSTLVSAKNSGKAPLPRNDIQGSYISHQEGMNYWLDDEGTTWTADVGDEDDGDAGWHSDITGGVLGAIGVYSNGIRVSEKNLTHFMRDIFDVDCSLLKAKNIFPCRSYKDYEGWTDSNMQVALMKLSSDWIDWYGFEVPLEIGDKWEKDEEDRTYSGYTLSSGDVAVIISLLEKQYGEEFTDERKKAIETALQFVGRGHYSDVHKIHDFLSVACNGNTTVNADGSMDEDTDEEERFTKMTGCCTASDNIGFINYVYNQSGKYTSRFDYRSKTEGENLASNGDAGSAKPADLLVRKFISTAYNDVDIGSNSWKKDDTIEVIKKYSHSDAVIYVGEFSSETLHGESYTLPTGQKIYAGVPVTIDLSQIHNVGNVWLHTEKPEDIMDLNGDTNYWWVTNPDLVFAYQFGT